MSPPAIKSTGDHTGSPLHARSDLDTNIRSIFEQVCYGFVATTSKRTSPTAAFPKTRSFRLRVLTALLDHFLDQRL